MHEHKSSVPNRGHCNFVFKITDSHRTGEFGFDDKCPSIYHNSCVFGLAAMRECPVYAIPADNLTIREEDAPGLKKQKRLAAIGSIQLKNY